MRVVFMGTPDFSVPTLKALLKAKEHEVVLVVTQPDKPKGREKKMQASPVKQMASQYQIPVFQPVKVKSQDAVDVIRKLLPDVIVVVAFGQILSKELLEIPKYGCINIHGSLLPKYRGAAPIQWAVIEGEKQTGLTAMFMDVGVDTGDMLKKVVVPIEKKETAESLYQKLAPLGGPLILEVLQELEKGTFVREKQNDAASCHAPILDKKCGKILWNKSAVEIERLIRGLNSWPSAYTTLDGKTLKIWDADVVEKDMSGQEGTVVLVSDNMLLIKTKKNCLSLKEVQLEGKKRMKVDAFLRGYKIKEGMILS